MKPRGNEVGGLRNAVLNNDRMRLCSAGQARSLAMRIETRDRNPGGLKIGPGINGGSHEREGRYTNQAVKPIN